MSDVCRDVAWESPGPGGEDRGRAMSVRSRLRHWLIGAAELVGRASGLDSLLRSRCRERLLILCYHGIVPDDVPPSPERLQPHPRCRAFRRHLELLARRFHVITMDEVRRHIREGAALPPYPAVITFDDGLRNNLTCAAPILRQMGLPATLFLSTGHIGEPHLLWTHEITERIVGWRGPLLPRPGGRPDLDLRAGWIDRWQLEAEIREGCKTLPHADRLAYLERLRQEPLRVDPVWQRDLYAFLSWDEVRSLQAQGWTLGGHTVSHSPLLRLSPSELRDELEASRRRIETELGEPCLYFAYPNGQTSPAVTRAVAEAGYELAFTLAGGFSNRGSHRHELDRINISSMSDATFFSKMGGLRSLRRPPGVPEGNPTVSPAPTAADRAR